MVAVSELWQREPGGGVPASRATTAYLGYDAENFFAVFVCKEEPARIRANMAKRESIVGDDAVGLVNDTFHDRRRAAVPREDELPGPVLTRWHGGRLYGGGGRRPSGKRAVRWCRNRRARPRSRREGKCPPLSGRGAIMGPGRATMIALRQVMVPTDFSEASECALKYGRAFAASFGASLHVVHVVEDFVAWSWAADTYVATLPRIREEVEAEAVARLGQLIPPPEAERLQAKVALLAGNPFIEIVRYAREHDIDLIVMGTHGRGPVAHALIGSVAERVVRKAHCPVLTVRHPQHEFVMP